MNGRAINCYQHPDMNVQELLIDMGVDVRSYASNLSMTIGDSTNPFTPVSIIIASDRMIYLTYDRGDRNNTYFQDVSVETDSASVVLAPYLGLRSSKLESFILSSKRT